MELIIQKIWHLYYCILTIISPKLNSVIRYKNTFKKKLDLENPKTFNEKGMWLKLYKYNGSPVIKQCADKFKVREYVRDKGCSEILNDVISVVDDVEQINWDKLPKQFVIKWNFGCGYNLICNDKTNLDIDKAIKQLKKWKRKKYYLYYSEMQYKKVNKKIIIEKYLKSSSGVQPEDYKFFCFNGKAEYVMICSGRETGNVKFLFFDREWKFIKINKQGMNLDDDFTIEKPSGMDKMFEYADRLSKGFPFVRVDFYNIEGKIIFGELTFTPAGFLDVGYTEQGEKILGEKISLN